MKRTFFVILISFLLTCVARAAPSDSVQQKTGTANSPYQAESGIAATIDPGRDITLADVDQSIAKQLHALKEKVFALRRTALESLIVRTLIESEARRAGVSVEELKKRWTTTDAPVTQRQIEDVYLENLAVFSSLSEDEAKEKIRLDLENQGRLRSYRARVTDLRNRATVRLFLKEPEPARIEVVSRGPFFGPADAPVTILEYSDFQCPYCRRAAATVKKVVEAYPGKVKVVFKHLPLPIHPQAFNAAQAAHCAQEQGGFAAYHDRLFEEDDLSGDRLKAIATQLGFNTNQFTACLASEASKAAIVEDLQEARRLGLQGTPTFVLNGRVLRGSVTFEEFKRLIDRELEAIRKEK